MNVLVTGGAGYIGSHTVVALLRAGYTVTVADNLSNSKRAVFERIKELGGRDFDICIVDLCDGGECDRLFERHRPDAVIHFAGLKAVGESVKKPLEYYRNNLTSALNVLASMKKYGVRNFVFSSSATVYGDPQSVPIPETAPRSALSPYGATKLMIEDIVTDLCAADPSFNAALLRYFNPIGADESGRIGEDPNGVPNNLVPYISQVAVGKLECLSIYGDDYDTPDGTCIRDYIHVSDLADGHLAALKKLEQAPGLVVYNLGTGRGCSVFEVVAAYEKAIGREIPKKIAARREGDAPQCFADVKKSRDELGFEAKRDINRMCADSWRWQKNNPDGYEGD